MEFNINNDYWDYRSMKKESKQVQTRKKNIITVEFPSLSDL